RRGAAPRCSPPRSDPRCWRERSPRAAAHRRADTAARRAWGWPARSSGSPHLRRPGQYPRRPGQGREAAAEPGPIRRSPSRGHGVWVPAFAGTTCGEAFGQTEPRLAHLATSHVVPSLESFNTTPMAASSSRMRSDSGQFFLARATKRWSILLFSTFIPTPSSTAFIAAEEINGDPYLVHSSRNLGFPQR